MSFNEMQQKKQRYLSLGQKDADFTQCSLCGMIYTPQKQEDMLLHRKFHKLQHGQDSYSKIKCNEAIHGKILLNPRLSLDKCRLSFTAILHSYGKSFNTWTRQESKLWRLKFHDQVVGFVWGILPKILPQSTSTNESKFAHTSTCCATLMYVKCDPDRFIEVVPLPKLKINVPVTIYVKFIWVNPCFRRKGFATSMLNGLRDLYKGHIAFDIPNDFKTASFFAYINQFDLEWLAKQQPTCKDYIKIRQTKNNLKVFFGVP